MEKEQNELFQLIEPYKEKLTTPKEWDDFAIKHNLPPSAILVEKSGTWNQLKKSLGLKVYKRYTKEQLEQIALKNKAYMKSKPVWDKYSKEQGLPSSQTFINAFGGKWDNVKDYLSIKTVLRQDVYSKSEIESILKEHGTNYESRNQWDEYAKENNLPTFKTIRKHFTYDEMMTTMGKKKHWLDDEDLYRVAIKHKEVFLTKSMAKWDEYAKEHDLPKSNTYHKRFGSWKKAKTAVIKRMSKSTV